MGNYEVFVRRYTAGEDDDNIDSFDTAEAAYNFLCRERRFGPFRAWVNDHEIKGACHGVSLAFFLGELNLARLSETSDIAAKVISDMDAMLGRPKRVITNPATHQALEGVERRLMQIDPQTHRVTGIFQ